MALGSLTREQAVEVLVACEAEIRALGVERLALFGSVLRSDARHLVMKGVDLRTLQELLGTRL